MPQQAPYLHLTLVESIADLVEVVVQQILQVVNLQTLELLKHLLTDALLLAPVKVSHDLVLTLGILAQELALSQLHAFDFQGLVAHRIDIGGQGSHAVQQLPPGRHILKVVFEHIEGSLLSRWFRHERQYVARGPNLPRQPLLECLASLLAH